MLYEAASRTTVDACTTTNNETDTCHNCIQLAVIAKQLVNTSLARVTIAHIQLAVISTIAKQLVNTRALNILAGVTNAHIQLAVISTIAKQLVNTKYISWSYY